MKTKKISLSFWTLLLFSVASSSLYCQPCKEHYNRKLNEGILAYNRNDYKAALGFFNDAHCLGITAAQIRNLNDWADKCTDALNAKNKKNRSSSNTNSVNATSRSGTNSKLTPGADILYSGYIMSRCNYGLRGAELKVVISTKDLQGKTIKVDCLIAPRYGSGKVISGTEWSDDYSVQDGKSGQKKIFNISEQDEVISTTFFVPYNIMDYDKNDVEQELQAKIIVFDGDTKQQYVSKDQSYNSIPTYSLSFNGRADYGEIVAPKSGGVIGWDSFAGCSIDILISNLPDWIYKDDEGIHVSNNNTNESRTVTIYATAKSGGNSISIKIIQRGGN